jgi:hypothetical protein
LRANYAQALQRVVALPVRVAVTAWWRRCGAAWRERWRGLGWLGGRWLMLGVAGCGVCHPDGDADDACPFVSLAALSSACGP